MKTSLGISVKRQHAAHERMMERKMQQPKPGHRYFLAQDNDCHWYVIPVANAAEWDVWCNLPDDDIRTDSHPKFAMMVGGAPSLVTFSNPEID